MDVPSSPPLFTESDAPDSPPFLPDEAADLPIRPSLLPVAGTSRKRQISEYGSLSSDPLFSEGSSDAEDADREERPKRKKLVRGPWWNLRRSSTQDLRRGMAKREKLRNADSGVWLGSDTSDGSSMYLPSSQEEQRDLDVEDSFSRVAIQPPARSPAEDHATEIITRCLETGSERVDITDLNLKTLSNTTLKPLHQLIRHSHSHLTHPPSEDEFTALTPSIQLFLSGNKLAALPSELFNLTNIAVLSLRNNDLIHIPPAISRLSNLQELNVAQNQLKSLPWEMLDILHCRGQHRQIAVRPNPLFNPCENVHAPSPLRRPRVTGPELIEHLNRWGETNGAFFGKMKQWYGEEGVEWTMRHELELRLKLGRLKRTNYLQEASGAGTELKLCREQLVYLASSAVRYFEVDGAPRRTTNSRIPHVEDDHFRPVIDPLVETPPPSEQKTTRSLFEMSLHSVQSHFSLSVQDLSDLPTDLPTGITSALQQAAKGTEFGNEHCSVCGKDFIIARAEWIEYWFNGFPSQECLTQETVLPFTRRACSWACARPSEMGSFRF